MGSIIGDGLGAIGGLVGSVGGGVNKAAGGNVTQFAVLPPHVEEQFETTFPAINNTYSRQMSLADTLLAQSKGEGPNPAADMLNMQTDKNNQNAAAMLAAQRGINPGLAARLASQQATDANQQAAGQAALMRAQQQLGAEQQLTGLYQGVADTKQREAESLMNTYNQVQNMNMQAYMGNAANNQKTAGGILNGIGGALGLAHGGVIAGKPSVQGDSYANDKVPVMLSPGEIVVPRSASSDEDKAKEFVESIIRSKKGKKDSGEEHGYSKVLKAKQSLKEALKHLEAHGAKGA